MLCTEAAPGFSAGGAEGFQGGTSMRILYSQGGGGQPQIRGGLKPHPAPPWLASGCVPKTYVLCT